MTNHTLKTLTVAKVSRFHGKIWHDNEEVLSEIFACFILLHNDNI